LSVGRPWHAGPETELHFEPAAAFTAQLAKVAFKGLPPGRILNVNAPNVPAGKLRGARVTRLGRRFYKDELIEVRDEGGRVGYDIYNNPPGHHDEEGTDFAAIGNGEISVTPVHLELTDTAGLEEIESWDVCGLLENGPR
jgi:5'-nucleotidase